MWKMLTEDAVTCKAMGWVVRMETDSEVAVLQNSLCKGTTGAQLGVIKCGNDYTSQIEDKNVETVRKLRMLPGSPGSQQQGARKNTAGEMLELDHAGSVPRL